MVVVAARGGGDGPGTSYLRAYFGKQGVPDENITVITAEWTPAGLAPHLSRFRPAAREKSRAFLPNGRWRLSPAPEDAKVTAPRSDEAR